MDGEIDIVMLAGNFGVAAALALYFAYQFVRQNNTILDSIVGRLDEIVKQQEKIIEKLDRLIDRIEGRGK